MKKCHKQFSYANNVRYIYQKMSWQIRLVKQKLVGITSSDENNKIIIDWT